MRPPSNFAPHGYGKIGIILTVLLLVLMPVATAWANARPPALVLQITVDQLRGDMIYRVEDRFGAAGFRYLLKNGLQYTDTHFGHASTRTATGHATLATGGGAAQHGMVGNNWYDAQSRHSVYSVEDPAYPVLAGDPRWGGRSPHRLESRTLGDELVKAGAGRARAFSVSTKDRAAIIMGGYEGKAYWFSTGTGNYATSTYYHETLPEWLARWNERHVADSMAGREWRLLRDPATYRAAGEGDRDYARPRGGMGQTFPHRLDKNSPASFYSALRYTPWADELTLQVVTALFEAEKVGQRGSTDYLSVSFSATDYVGHAFGPESLQAEDNLLRLDRVLAELFQLVDRRVGLARTLIVLSADHGVMPAPEYSMELGHEAGRIGFDPLLKPLNRAMAQRFETQYDLVRTYIKPSVYLDLDAVADLGLDVAVVERALADEILSRPGFAIAVTRSDLLAGNVPDTALGKRLLAAFHPVRSGNVLAFPAPLWYLSGTSHGDAATHGTPYFQDTHVPLIFAGPGVKPGVVKRRVAPRDIVPTLADYLGVPVPSGSVGSVLPEVTGAAE
jgi:predicted AlkP superfamily pyrophosphatase or phosphodiesterase